MDLNSINANINRLLTNIWAVISFLKEFTVDGAKDVSITYINVDGSESVKTFPNVSKMWETFNITNDGGVVKDLDGNILTGASRYWHLNNGENITVADDSFYDCKITVQTKPNHRYIVNIMCQMHPDNPADYTGIGFSTQEHYGYKSNTSSYSPIFYNGVVAGDGNMKDMGLRITTIDNDSNPFMIGHTISITEFREV